MSQTGKMYEDYQQLTITRTIETPKPGIITMKPIKVPELNIRRFKESKNMIAPTNKRFGYMEGWLHE